MYYLLFPVLLFQSIVKSPINVGEATSLVVAAVSTASSCQMPGARMGYNGAHVAGLVTRCPPCWG